MLYQRTENVAGFTGAMDAISSHPNVTTVYNKVDEPVSGTRTYRRHRVEFLVGPYHAALESLYRRLTTDPVESFEPYVRANEIVGNISKNTFDPDVLTENIRLEAVDPLTQGSLPIDSNVSAGVRAGVSGAFEGGVDLGLSDDNHTLHAIHVFADSENLYVIWEPEENLFFHWCVTSGIEKHRAFGDTVMCKGSYALFTTSDASRRIGYGWQYTVNGRCPFLLNEDLEISDRSNDEVYGFQLNSSMLDGVSDRIVCGGTSITLDASGDLVVGGNSENYPGSDQLTYGSYSSYGRDLAVPLRWWYRPQNNFRMYPLFTLNNIKQIHMRNVNPLDEIVIDGQTWVAFPDIKKPAAYGGTVSSLLSDIDDYALSTPLGVLIRKD